MKNVFRYLSAITNLGILYDGINENVYPEGFSDSDYADDLDTRRLTIDYVFKLAGGTITWDSFRQRIVSLSTTEAEYIAVCETVKEV